MYLCSNSKLEKTPQFFHARMEEILSPDNILSHKRKNRLQLVQKLPACTTHIAQQAPHLKTINICFFN